MNGYNHVRAQPSAIFDTGLSDVAFIDAISMRLGLSVFSTEQASVCSAPLDIGYLYVSCHHLPYGGGKGPMI